MRKTTSVFAGIKRKLSLFKIDALLVSSPVNIRYLAGFFTHGALILVPAEGAPVYFLDGMNKTLGKKFIKAKGLYIVSSEKSPARNLTDFLKSKGIKKLGLNDKNVTLERYNDLLKFLPGLKITSSAKHVNFSSILEGIREIKTASEIKIIRKAAGETVRIWKKVSRCITPGMTEQKIAGMIDTEIHARGYETSFQTIVASGENTAYPHAVPTTRRFKKNEHLLVDFGIKAEGYCSDLTRTLYNGRINPQIEDFRKFVSEAQKEAIKKVKPGVLLSSVAEGINKLFIRRGVREYILHGAGHGVGCEVHEEPFFRKNSKKRFKEGMVITIEPGLYKAGTGGVRFEDMVLVTEKENEVLTR